MLKIILILVLCVSAVVSILILYFTLYRTSSNHHFVSSHDNPCVPRDFGNGGVVCVCNATYCDFTAHSIVPEKGQFLQYTSSIDGLRLHKSVNNFNNGFSKSVVLLLNSSVTYQRIHGFGAAFTDAAGINVKSLSSGAQENLMRSFFSTEGSNYNLGRVPIAGTDFSTRKYTYDDVADDILLQHFNLTVEDFVFKIPLMQKSLQMNPEMRFLAAAWTAPPWMKSNNDYIGYGFLEKKYYQVYTNYLLKFLDAYKSHGLEMWALSTGNEPVVGASPTVTLNNMIWTPSAIADWLGENLGPSLRSSKHKKTLIQAFDDVRLNLPWFITHMFENDAAKHYTDSVAVHWYLDGFFPVSVLDRTHEMFPDKFILMTEAAIGKGPLGLTNVLLGSWKRGEAYIINIIENLNHWVTGWVDWNFALDQKGGPTWSENYLDATIIVNGNADEFYKQPTFYAIAHFSKFVPRGSLRIQITGNKNIKSVAFKTPNNETVLILYNKKGYKRKVTVHDPDRGNINLKLSRHSVHTIIYK